MARQLHTPIVCSLRWELNNLQVPAIHSRWILMRNKTRLCVWVWKYCLESIVWYSNTCFTIFSKGDSIPNRTDSLYIRCLTAWLSDIHYTFIRPTRLNKIRGNDLLWKLSITSRNLLEQIWKYIQLKEILSLKRKCSMATN